MPFETTLNNECQREFQNGKRKQDTQLSITIATRPNIAPATPPTMLPLCKEDFGGEGVSGVRMLERFVLVPVKVVTGATGRKGEGAAVV